MFHVFSHLKPYKFAVFIPVLLLVCFLSATTVVGAKGDLQAIDGFKKKNAPVTITLGKAELIDIGSDVADVLVANPSVVDVMAVQSNRLYVVGVNIGDTNIIVTDAMGGIVKKIDIHVTYDLLAIQTLVDDLFPKENIKVGAVHNRILLTGNVSTPDTATKVSDIVGNYVNGVTGAQGEIDDVISNFMGVRGEQQVMLQVKIVEASRSVIKELGLETNANDLNEGSSVNIFGSSPGTSQFGSSNGTNSFSELLFATGGGIGTSQDPAGIGRLLFDSGINGIGTIGLFLNALEEENLVNILAEPNLTAVSGEQAGFLAGGEFPVPVGRDQVGNLVIEFREFGVSLNFRPMVLSDDRISLQLNTEVSSLDFEDAIVLADVTVPGLDVRRAETTVEVPSGGSLMIAGLLQSEAVKGMAGLPGVRKTPVIGDLVKSDSFQRDETELLIIITPVLVEPYADKKQAEKVPEERVRPLAQAFTANIRRNYDLKDEDFLGDGKAGFGYLID